MNRKTTPTRRSTARRRNTLFVTWLAFALGTLTSVTLNVLDMMHVSSEPVARGTAAVWPLFGVLGVALLTHVDWSPGRLWALARFGGVGLVAVGAMVISYTHGHAVLELWGEDALSATMGPLIIDGLELISSAALLALHSRRTPIRPASKPATARKTATRRRPAAQLAAA